MVVSVRLVGGEHRLVGDWAALDVANGFLEHLRASVARGMRSWLSCLVDVAWAGTPCRPGAEAVKLQPSDVADVWRKWDPARSRIATYIQIAIEYGKN